MGFFSRALEVRASKFGGVRPSSSTGLEWLSAPDSGTGLNITEQTAMQSSVVYACVRILAETLASLPLQIFERVGAGKELADAHRLYPLLHGPPGPNPEMTAFDWRETAMGHLCLWGNHYSEIERDGANRVVAIWPLRPDRMVVWRDPDGREVQYQYQFANESVILDPANVLHIRTQSYDGLKGISPIGQQREAIGLGIALEMFAAKLFGNGARPGGILSAPKRLSDDARKNILESWQAFHGGLTNAHRVAVLEEGVTWQALGIPPDDAQFIASRQYQVGDIARIYRVPLHLLQELSRSTNNNIEHQGLDFVIHTVRPWAVRWEQAIARSLFSTPDQSRFFAEFNLDGMARGTLLERYQAYQIGIQGGWLNPNDVRGRENMNPRTDPGGDAFLTPLNMAPSNAPAPDNQPQDTGDQTTGDGGDVPADDGASPNRMLVQDVLLREAAAIIRRERVDVMQKAKKLLKKDPQGFARWLDEFYEEHRAWIPDHLGPLPKWAPAGFAESFAARHVAASLMEIRKALRSPTPEETLGELFDQWEAERVSQIAKTEAFGVEKRQDVPPAPPINVTVSTPPVNVTVTPPQVTIAEGAFRSDTVIADGAIRGGDVHIDPPPPALPAQVTFNEGALRTGDVNVAPAEVTVPITVPPQNLINNVEPAQVTQTFESPNFTFEAPAPVVVPAPIVTQHNTFETPIVNRMDPPAVTIMPQEIKVTLPPAQPSKPDPLAEKKETLRKKRRVEP